MGQKKGPLGTNGLILQQLSMADAWKDPKHVFDVTALGSVWKFKIFWQVGIEIFRLKEQGSRVWYKIVLLAIIMNIPFLSGHILTARMCRDVFRLLSIIYGRGYCGNSSQLSEYIVYMSIWCAMWLLTHLFPMHPFSSPWKHKITAVSWCLHGAKKGSIGNKWVNFATTLHGRCLKRS